MTHGRSHLDSQELTSVGICSQILSSNHASVILLSAWEILLFLQGILMTILFLFFILHMGIEIEPRTSQIPSEPSTTELNHLPIRLIPVKSDTNICDNY